MTRSASIANLKSHLSDALRRGDWLMAERFLERGKALLLDASASGEASHLQELRLALADVHARLAAEHGVPGRLDAKNLTWMIRADAQTAAMAETLLPATSRIGKDEDVQSARGLVLGTLDRANRGRSSTEISATTNLAKETVSRVLAVLRTEGKVRTVKAGRKRISFITDVGRAELRGERFNAGSERRMFRRFMRTESARTDSTKHATFTTSTKNPRPTAGVRYAVESERERARREHHVPNPEVDVGSLVIEPDHRPAARQYA